jgi:hypothetical protein
MALLFITGFDLYGPANSNSAGVTALLTAGEWTSCTATVNIVAPLSATGQALSITGSVVNISKTLAGNYSRLIGGFRLSNNLGSASCGVQFRDGASDQLGIQFNATGTFSVRNGNYSAGTVLGTSSATVTASTTHYLEFDITFANAGSYQLWLDGVSILSGSGDTTATANAYANGFQFISGNAAALVTIDDLYLFDTTGSANNAVLLTSPRVETTFPASDSAVQFGLGAGILGSNAARVTTTTAPAAGSLVLRRFTSSVACTINSITVMPGATSAPANYRGVIYADSGGTAPGTLMSSGTQVTGVTSGTAKDLPLTTPQSLAAGTQYWIGFINDTSVALQQTDAGLLGYRAANTYASGAPGTAPAMTSGQASYLLWGNLSGISGANYNEVNQQPPPGAYAYVFDATVNHEDLYTFGALSATPGAVHAVAVKAYCQRSDSGAKTVSMRMKSGSTDSGGSATGQTPATTYGWLTSYFPTDPNTSAAWTGANLNAATAGFKVDS